MPPPCRRPARPGAMAEAVLATLALALAQRGAALSAHASATPPSDGATTVLAARAAPNAPGAGPSVAGAMTRPGDYDVATWVVRLDWPTLIDTHDALAAEARAQGRALDAGDRRALLAAQAALASRLAEFQVRLEDLGLQVIDTLQAVAAGYLVRATPEAAASAAALPAVTSVARAPVLAPARSQVVPQIGAPAVWEELGLTGKDILVAILDTGIDYTHRDFGGPGTVEAYLANDENIVESGTFPTRKVVGGYDLAGRRYSPHPSCIEPNPPSQGCTKTPRPDDDPLDSRGHGTHVAGVVAGLGLPGLERGVAPAARLVALKIFGNPIDAPVVTDLMPAAFDWVFRNNIDAELPGWPTDRIQVIDMSLTSAWLGGAYETRELIRAANERGITVVVAAGNDGAMPYLMGPLAGAETALTVGAAWPTGQHGLEYRAQWIDSGPRQLAGLAYDTRIAGQVTTRESPIEGSLAWMGTGCNGQAPVQPVAGMVALVARGDCPFTEKIGNAQTLGAKAVVVFTTADLPASEMGGTARLSIPAAMIDHEAGATLQGVLEGGLAVTIQVSEPADRDVRGGTAARFSSRGPSRFQPGLKPQLVAPGLRVTSTRVGSGDGVEEASGTSVAASVAAGAAALLWQRVVDDKLPLTAADIAATLENHARSDVRFDHSTLGPLAPAAARGAGFLDARAAAGTGTVVRSDQGLAEIDLGLLHVTSTPVERAATLTVHNIGPQDRSYRVASRFLFPDEDEGQGVYVTAEPQTLAVAAGDAGEITVRLRVVPAELRPWNLYAVEAVINPRLVGQMEVDGLVDIVETDASGADRPGGDVITVPWLALAVRHSCVRSVTSGPFVVSTPGDKVRQSFENPCPTPGWVNVYSLLAEDPQEPAVPPALDITAIAFRRYLRDPADPSSDVIMEWAIRTEGPRRTPAAAQFRIYVDVNSDGEFDSVVYNLDAQEIGRFVPETFDKGRWLNAQGPLVPGTMEPDNFGIRAWTYEPYQLDESTTVLIASADEMGLDLRSGFETFRFAVAAVDISGDNPVTADFPGHDYAPDALAATGGETFIYDQAVNDCMAFATRVDVPGESTADTTWEMYCPEPDRSGTFGMFLSYTSNAPGDDAALRHGSFGAGAHYLIHLPYAAQHAFPPGQ